MPGTNSSHGWCRLVLAKVMKQVKEDFNPEDIASTWAHKTSAGFEWHGPDKFYHFSGKKACCKWYAAAEGWQAYYQHLDK